MPAAEVSLAWISAPSNTCFSRAWNVDFPVPRPPVSQATGRQSSAPPMSAAPIQPSIRWASTSPRFQFQERTRSSSRSPAASTSGATSTGRGNAGAAG